MRFGTWPRALLDSGDEADARLKVSRAIVVIGAIALAASWPLARYGLGLNDPLPLRAAAVASLIALWAASFAGKRARDQYHLAIVGMTYVMTAYFFYLLILNAFTFAYMVNIILVIGVIGVIFPFSFRMRELLAPFLLTVTAASVVAALLTPSAGPARWYFVIIQATLSAFAYVALLLRLAITERLQAALVDKPPPPHGLMRPQRASWYYVRSVAPLFRSWSRLRATCWTRPRGGSSWLTAAPA